MTSANTSGRRTSRPIDPLYQAKRKRLIAEEFAANGTHAAIKKTITWGDMVKDAEGRSASKRPRLSQSESVTPGLSDMSTPTPIHRASLHSALKSARGPKASFSPPKPRSSSQPKKHVVLVSPHRSGGRISHSQPELAPRMPAAPTPAPRKVLTQPEVIQISEETSEGSDREAGPPDNQSLPPAPVEEPTRSPSPPPVLGSPTSDAGTQYQEQDIRDGNEWLTRQISPARAASLPPPRPASPHERAASPASPTGDDPAPRAQSPPGPPVLEAEPAEADQPRRQRRTSEVGIQTIPDNQVDWLEGLDVDESMSAIDVSRVWVDHMSPKKARAGSENAPTGDEHRGDDNEPLTGNFLDHLEGETSGRQDDGPEEETDELGVSNEQPDDNAVPDAQTGLDQPEEEYEEQVEPEHAASDQEQAPISAEPVPRQPSPGAASLLGDDSARAADPEPPAPLPASFPRKSASQPTTTTLDPDAHGSTSRMPATQPGTQPYPFKLQERKAEIVTESRLPSRVPTATTAPEAGGSQEARPTVATSPTRPISSSQPNPFAPRARSRLYTPQPGPAPRPSQELRAATTLGRSMLGNEGASQPSTSATLNPASKTNPSLSMLKASPTLGRSSEWKDSISTNPTSSQKGKAKAIDTPSSQRRSVGATSGVATDYDAEYGPLPDIRSSLPPPNSRSVSRGRTPIMVSSSPSRHAWELEPSYTSTPQRFQTRLSPIAAESARDEAQENEPSAEKRGPDLTSPAKPTSLGALDKRRRSSVAPSSQQSSSLPTKKIRREYDTVESTATPYVRAHKDEYDESGHRTWVPRRPPMKRAPEGKGKNKPIVPRYLNLDSEMSERQSLLGSDRETRVGESVPEEPENQLGLEQGQSDQQALEEYERANFTPAFGAPSTEIAETPQQVAPTRNLFDISSDPQVQTPVIDRLEPIAATPNPVVEHVPVPEPTQPVAGASHPAPRPPQPRADSLQPDASINRPSNPILAPVAEDVAPAPHSPAGSRESSVVRLDNKSYQKQPSRLKRQRQSLQATPALRPIWSPPRTRLSLGNRSGISLAHVSKSDQEILVQAGLKPTLKRLSEAHGFTVDVIASVYQDMGSLKETEVTLEKMKRSADKIRVDLTRRKSFRGPDVEVLHGEERPLGSSDDENEERSGDYRDWDTSRTGSRILFGDHV